MLGMTLNFHGVSLEMPTEVYQSGSRCVGFLSQIRNGRDPSLQCVDTLLDLNDEFFQHIFSSLLKACFIFFWIIYKNFADFETIDLQ